MKYRIPDRPFLVPQARSIYTITRGKKAKDKNISDYFFSSTKQKRKNYAICVSKKKRNEKKNEETKRGYARTRGGADNLTKYSSRPI